MNCSATDDDDDDKDNALLTIRSLVRSSAATVSVDLGPSEL